MNMSTSLQDFPKSEIAKFKHGTKLTIRCVIFILPGITENDLRLRKFYYLINK